MVDKTTLKKIFILPIALQTAVFISYCLFPINFILRPFSKRYTIYLNGLVASIWFKFVVFAFTVLHGIKITIYGDDVPEDENAVIIMNHPSEIDWAYTWILGAMKNSLGNIKIIMKDEIKYVPGVGWGCDCLGWIYITRDWAYDEKHLQHHLTKDKDIGHRTWLTIFPEGTDMDEEKLAKSHAFAEKNGFPKFNNVLLPRVKGVHTSISSMRPELQAVYDLTIGYETKPSIVSNLIGTNPRKVDINIRRIPISNVPKEENETQDWLFKIFAEKEQLLEHLKKHKTYPTKGRLYEPDTSVYVYGILFLALIPWSIYTFFTSYYARWFTAIATTVFIINSASHQVRLLRGSDVPRPRKVHKA
ncbi:hypothetical protein SAMD00019534_054160 [Acytostelium subglobosum LB1]|uniref:hypothetical protein n=1 Tax=Acytostelium subglobosum LB1 TaxID=1410327 RepID=UPI00064483D8|nr:hypothetical protein SAMD00019534_054160 [Acytostelium subglobosum LB1]GAM22241.1 hypothetical protein SAMD00019534_054160 [Acytostelium subglobosum LB1]|eukprot:XP_012754361.1 hypothetical protein SAMD00019534_054160 [Acytostelium subglobosum LB1]